MTDPEEERDVDMDELTTRLAAMGVEASGWLHALDDLEELGVDVDEIERAVCLAILDVQRKAAEASGRKLYDVMIRYRNVLAKDKDEAIQEAEGGFGQLVERRADVVYDPDREAGSAGKGTGRSKASDLERGATADPDLADWGEFLRLIDELCIDPVTGETVLPDFVLISEELYDRIVDQDPGLLRPRKEPTDLGFAVRIAPHEELVDISGTDAHLLVSDRRRTLEETVQAWDAPDEGWDEAVRRTVDA